MVKAYISAILFNEDLKKPGANSEKHYGLLKPNRSITYDIGYSGLKSSLSASPPHLTFKDIHAQGSLATSNIDRSQMLYGSRPIFDHLV